MAGIAAAILGFFVIAALLIKLIAGDMIGLGGNTKKRAPGSAAALSLTNYRENANSLRGNLYQVEGKIEEMLRWSENGRLLSFDATEGSGSIPVPIFVPSEFSTVNLERGAEMRIVVQVDREGMLVAKSIDN